MTSGPIRCSRNERRPLRPSWRRGLGYHGSAPRRAGGPERDGSGGQGGGQGGDTTAASLAISTMGAIRPPASGVTGDRSRRGEHLVARGAHRCDRRPHPARALARPGRHRRVCRGGPRRLTGEVVPSRNSPRPALRPDRWATGYAGQSAAGTAPALSGAVALAPRCWARATACAQNVCGMGFPRPPWRLRQVVIAVPSG
jgi:hypothetical protein